MKMLVVSATNAELSPLKHSLAFSGGSYRFENHILELLVSGVGMVSTAYCLGQFFAIVKDFDLVINIGIAGSFNRSFELGEVVNVNTDSIFEIGAEDGSDFIPADHLGLVNRRDIVFKSNNSYECAVLNNLKTANGITVNKVHGNQPTIELLQKKNNPDVETMEGAAFFYACEQAQLSTIQLRAISNYVEERNRDSWKLDLAIENLTSKTLDVIQDIT